MDRAMSEQDHARVSAAIQAAEANTSGEIYCVLAGASDDYFHAAAFTVTLTIVAVSLAVAAVLDRAWLSLNLLQFVLAEVLALALALALIRALPQLRIRLVPRRLRYRRAHDNAVRQFLARNVHRTSARTGILVFVSVAERYAEVVADSGIAARVTQSAWDEIVAHLTATAREGRLADGFVQAAEAAGILLAEHFPPMAGDANELDDHLVEI